MKAGFWWKKNKLKMDEKIAVINRKINWWYDKYVLVYKQAKIILSENHRKTEISNEILWKSVTMKEKVVLKKN